MKFLNILLCKVKQNSSTYLKNSEKQMPQRQQTFESPALGLYCHVPFCAHRCKYCAFYKEAPTSESIDRYLSGLAKEFSLLKIENPFSSIYVGGGTPGVLAGENLERLCQILTQNNGSLRASEFSIEFSPATVKREKIEIAKNYSCNRITLGIQSFNAKTLQTLGRRQTSKQVTDACEIISSCGIENTGIDLIFGIPNQTLEEWLADLQCAINLRPKHISTYNLTFENGTELRANLMDGEFEQKSIDDEAEFYLRTCDFLTNSGYRQYEISNFCLPGFESIHNSNTWEMQNWIGIGPSACSQYGGSRFSNPPSIRQWLEPLEQNKLAHGNVEIIDERNFLLDSIIFGLRMNRGINIFRLRNNHRRIDFSQLDELFANLVAENLAQTHGEFTRLTSNGRLVADAIAVEILETL
ncbi:MAG: radical SAM family heme chaperone HemW [Puniceicoccales bacterium]|nr:radical SAM family heme chaperone HemW [Puniceicoccales bacterium]